MRLVPSALALAFLAAVTPTASAEAPHAPDRLLIKLRPEAAAAALPAFGRPKPALGIASLDAVLRTLGARTVERLLPGAPVRARAAAEALGIERWCLVRFPDGVDIEAARTSLAASSDVEIAELDYWGEGGAVTPTDPSFGNQWHLKNNVKPGADIHATDAWAYTTGSASVVVGILDSGGDWDHVDLYTRIWANLDEIPDNMVDDDGNGYVDDTRGWDFVNNDNDPMDDHGHGTHVSGIVGAGANNGWGGVGVDWNCRLLLAKNLNAANSGLYSWWASSIYYAANQGAKVLNMSEGGTGFSALLQDAVNYAHGLGALVVVAMMNANSATPYYPAAYANPIAVGATNNQDDRAVPICASGGSSFGPHIDLMAPGSLIYSTLWDNSFASWCGTSMATPQVSGAAALMWGMVPGLTNVEVRDILLATADDQVGNPLEDTPGFDIFFGYGRLNLNDALAVVATPVQVTLVTAQAETDRVRLEWLIPSSSSWTATVERRDPATEWQALGEIAADGTGRLLYEDRAVVPGARHGYRLAYREDTDLLHSDEVWVDIPAPRLALDGIFPNPSRGDPLISFSLASPAPATLELYDLRGRRVLARELGSLGARAHALRLEAGGTLPAGVYTLRLRQGSSVATARAVVVR